MSSEPVVSGHRTPQQARSRRALEKMLAAAEDLLDSQGADDFTMAAVAERSGVSIGAIYRRFEGREQLLAAVKDRLLSGYERELAERLRMAEPSLIGVVRAFVRAIADALAAHRQVLPVLLMTPGGEAAQRGRQSLATTHQLFREAVAPYRDQTRRRDPDQALATVQAMITSACIHRCVQGMAPDELSWDAFTGGLAEMAAAFLLADG